MAFNDDKESKRNLSETDEIDSNQPDQDESTNENLTMKSKPVKKHKCPFCDKHFTQPNNVSRHISGVHEGEKPFVCETCGASFSQNKNLAVHVAAKHDGKKPFQCELCGVSYREKRCLQRHSLRMHKKSLDECLINKIPSIPVTSTDLNDQKKCKQKVKPVYREQKRPSASKNKVPPELKAKSPKLDLKPQSSVSLDTEVPKSPNKKSDKKSFEDIKELHDHEDFQDSNEDFQKSNTNFQKSNVNFEESKEKIQESHEDFYDPNGDFQDPNEDFQDPNEDFQDPNEDFQNSNVDFQESQEKFQKPYEDLYDLHGDFQDHNKIEISENPWQVESIQAFYCLKCPECNFFTGEENNFENHATENHPLSFTFFGQNYKEAEFDIKEEPMNYEGDEIRNSADEKFSSDEKVNYYQVNLTKTEDIHGKVFNN